MLTHTQQQMLFLVSFPKHFLGFIWETGGVCEMASEPAFVSRAVAFLKTASHLASRSAARVLANLARDGLRINR